MAKSKKPDGGDYEVGYGKPPKARQFKPGQSGNPGGRKKGSQNVSTTLTEVLGQQMEISENGKRQLVTFEKALILRWVQEGIKGNVRAIEGIFDRKQLIELAGAESAQDQSAEDAALLERYVQQQVQAAIADHLRKGSTVSETPAEDNGDV